MFESRSARQSSDQFIQQAPKEILTRISLYPAHLASVLHKDESGRIADRSPKVHFRGIVPVQINHPKRNCRSDLGFPVNWAYRSIPGVAIGTALAPEHHQFGSKARLGRDNPHHGRAESLKEHPTHDLLPPRPKTIYSTN